MKKLDFDYYMQIDYNVEVERCNFTIKCIPANTARQRIDSYQIQLYPDVEFQRGVDGLGNLQIYGLNEEPHKTFSFHIHGTAETGLSEYEEEENEDISMLFRHPHGLNCSGDAICAYYKKIQPDHMRQPFERAKEMMECLHRDFQYQSGITNISTSAEEAFLLGKGVCQDYAHIFLALLHLDGIAARYVTGLLIGEGASHAWVEVLSDGKWYGLDPTNNQIAAEQHIRIGVGRDARDCMINRGIMHGGRGPQKLLIQVRVLETNGDICCS